MKEITRKWKGTAGTPKPSNQCPLYEKSTYIDFISLWLCI